MILPLNADVLARTYDYLCELPPFAKYSLPPSEDIKFAVIRSRKLFGRYFMVGGVHHIEISRANVGSHIVLLSTMSHEMLHLHLEEVGACDMHGPVFQKFADRVCKIHGFDRLTF